MGFRLVPAVLRGVALVPIAVLAVHHLRYWLSFGGRAGHELAAQGHGYLGGLVPWVVLCAGFGAGALLGRVATAWRSPGRARSAPGSFLRLWAASAAVLLAVYAGQELLEGWLSSGHAVGLAGVFGAGGWTAVPAALGVGLVLAAAFCGTEVLVARLAGGPGRRPARIARRSLRPHLNVSARVVAPMANGAAGRAPPAFA